MRAIVARASQPALAAIKLAWWRERLERLDEGEVPAEPRLEAAARELLPRGIGGAQLAGLEAGWAELLQQSPDPDAVLERGVRLFEMAGRLLTERPSGVLSSAGRIYVGGQLDRNRMHVPGLALVSQGGPVPRRFRSLTGLAALARRDMRNGAAVEPEATPARAWTLLRHRLTGRI